MRIEELDLVYSKCVGLAKGKTLITLLLLKPTFVLLDLFDSVFCNSSPGKSDGRCNSIDV